MAGLPPAGVNLQAQGFRDYLKKLDDIDKKQRAVFDRDFSGGDRSYKQIISASKQYERQLQQELKALQRNEAERRKLAQAADREAERAATDRTRRANRALGVGLAVGGFAIAQGFDLAKQGAAIEAQQQGLANLAASYGQTSSGIIAAMSRASNGVLSNSAIMEAANKALLLEVAQTPEEFERVTRNALVLGRTLGLDAPEAIEQFTSALGRKSLLILDNFGLKASQVNAELDRLGRQQFGKGLSDLSAIQKDALFIEAALAAADKRVAAIGENGDSAAVQIERMAAASANAKDQFALLLKDIGESTGLFKGIADAGQGIADDLRGLRAAFGFGSTQDQIAGTQHQIEELQESLQRLGPSSAVDAEIAKLQQHLAELQTEENAQTAAAKSAGAAQQAFAAATDDTTDAVKGQTDELRKQEQAIRQQQQVIRQAEGIALNFARAQEDALRNLNRSQARLDEQQAKARNKLFVDQQKQLDKLEADTAKDRVKAQADAAKQEAKLRKDSAQREVDESRQLQRQLKQDLDRFNLDRLQSSRRFQLSDRRLRAEGDILGLQQLREDFALSEQEARENFGLNRSQQQDEANERQRLQRRDNEAQIEELRAGLAEQNAEFEASLDERRAELLTSFDEQEADLRQSQQEQRDDLLRSYQEQLEDLNFNRQRQLEDLGRSLIEQEGITRDGAQKIADALEEAFGVEGTADIIMAAFAERQASNFQDLFESIGESVEQAAGATSAETSPTDIRRRYPQLPTFKDGGIVPGAEGSPVNVLAHGGEMFLNRGQQTQIARMLAPVVPSQRLTIGGGATFKVDAPAGTSANVVNEAIMEITQSFDEAVRRLERRR